MTMELLVVIGIIIGLVVIYFSLGIALKFIWGWWILALVTPICIFVSFTYGWIGAIAGIVVLFIALGLNNEWHDNPYYLSISKKIDSKFYLSDT